MNIYAELKESLFPWLTEPGRGLTPSMLLPRSASRLSLLSPSLSHFLPFRCSHNFFFVEKDVTTPYTFCFAPLAAEMLKNVE
ncbi:hypothetical protein FJTKL_03047 [Diaporthe vaccinii]|uniref:Uncharacterized protein n=1 Tax=Diaporthe vaccinii TaxID=105482 RepID=A0ABR4DW88_9PEZI